MEIAHINKLGEKQSVAEHLSGTAKLAEQFADEFGCGRAACLCGYMHDIGKYSDAFQKRIRDPEHQKKVDHSTAGAKELCRMSADYICLAMAVAGHHSGLLDGGNSKIAQAGDGTFFGRLKSEIPSYEKWKGEISLDATLRNGALPAFCMERTNPAFTMSFFIRMMYSCLVDADYLDTEKFMSVKSVIRSVYSPVSELMQCFQKYISGWIQREVFDNEKQKQISQRRTKVLLDCMQKGEKLEQGIYTLTVPTGGGKTTASLGFALKHMQKHGMKRVIYVVPYTSIIDQIAKVFVEILGEDNVLEHHSGITYEARDDSQENYHKALATENWDKPVIVTTAVQFFESLYASKSSKCRKLHNIANSVIVFDEAQSLPVPYLIPCVAAMGELAAHYHSTVVLCTATQPVLEQVFENYLPDIKIHEICDDVEELYDWFRRTRIVHMGTLDSGELCGKLMENEQVLCIVNQRKTAQELYEHISQDGSYCLTTLIYPAARKRKLEEIKRRLDEGLPCRVVATSLMEAGVDLDFPKVYRQEAGLDSVIQAAGRCNREGKRPIDESVVSVFGLEGSRVSYLSQNIAAFQWIQHQFEDLGDLRAVSSYFLFYRELLGEENLDVAEVMQSFERGRNGKIFPFQTVAKEFHLMKDETTSVYIPLGEGETLVNRIISGKYDRDTFRHLGKYSVNVFPDHLKALLEGGYLKQLDSEIYVLHDLQKYKEDTGLQMDIETGNGIFI